MGKLLSKIKTGEYKLTENDQYQIIGEVNEVRIVLIDTKSNYFLIKNHNTSDQP